MNKWQFFYARHQLIKAAVIQEAYIVQRKLDNYCKIALEIAK